MKIEREFTTVTTKESHNNFTTIFQVNATAPFNSTEKGVEDVVLERSRLNLSPIAATLFMPPDTYSTYFRKNKLLLEDLLPLFEKDEEDGPPSKKKWYNKFCFRDILRKNLVINERHYQELLKTNTELQECKVALNLSQLEGYKKLIFVQNFRKLSSTFEILFCTTFREKNRLGIVCRFLKTIALENNLDVSELVDKLKRWYFKLHHKKLGFILYGRTNSGKSLLADL